MAAKPAPSRDQPDRMRSVNVIGAVGLVIIGGATIGDAMGLFRRDCERTEMATSAADCARLGADCARLFASGAPAVALTRTAAGWTTTPLRREGAGFVDPAGRPFQARTCSSSGSRSSSGGWWGYSSGGTGSSTTSSPSSRQSAPSSTDRGGFGSTAQSMSFSSSGT